MQIGKRQSARRLWRKPRGKERKQNAKKLNRKPHWQRPLRPRLSGNGRSKPNDKRRHARPQLRSQHEKTLNGNVRPRPAVARRNHWLLLGQASTKARSRENSRS